MLLVIMPHPDDESFACGGTIVLWARQGRPVTYLCATRGEMGRNLGNPPFANRESLPSLREAEQRKAAAILGISEVRFMGLRDKTLEFLDPVALAQQVGAVITELKPARIITYHPTESVHPDHMALGAATIAAVGALPPEQRPPVYTVAFSERVDQLGEPDLVVDVSSVLDVKLEAIRAHRSQSELMLAKIEADPAAREAAIARRSLERFWLWQFE